jgi:Uma2 family endonuclease
VTLEDGEPEPDGAIVIGGPRDYADRHPGPADVAVVIEIADATLDRDRGIKLRSYARAKIPAYWIINLVDRQVEVYTNPTGDGADATYDARAVIDAAGTVALAVGDKPAAAIRVADLLP